MSNYKLRKLEEKDYIQYIRLINSSITKYFFNNFIRNTLHDNHIIYVIEFDNLLIATGILLIEEKLTNDGCFMGHIENILVDEKYRGKGFGEIIVKKLLEIAKNRGCYRVDLICKPELENFYKKNNLQNNNIGMNILFKENFKV